MVLNLPAGRQSGRSALLGWAIFVSFAVLLWNIVTMPRTALDQRAFLHSMHYSVGIIVFLLACVRLVHWTRESPPQPVAGLPAASFAFNRAILVALLLVFAAEGFIGFAYAWGTGHDVSFFGLQLPALLPKGESTRMAMGYFHSALGFYYLMLFANWMAFGLYQHLRYRAGLRRLLPGVRV
ncbi:MAG: hypothetical protein ACE5G3_07165 [Gammaproteobacteria bacterium]